MPKQPFVEGLVFKTLKGHTLAFQFGYWDSVEKAPPSGVTGRLTAQVRSHKQKAWS